MWKIFDKTTNTEIKLGDLVTDFHHTEWTYCGFTPPKHAFSTGRVHLQRVTRQNVLTNVDFYPGVINAEIFLVPNELNHAFDGLPEID